MTPANVFKPWIVKRPDGGCQVLFPLTELDSLVEGVAKIVRQRDESALVDALRAANIKLTARERDIKRAAEAIDRAETCWMTPNAAAFLHAARQALQPLPEAPDAGN